MAEQEPLNFSPRKQFDYEAFIEELKELSKQGHNFPARDQNASSQSFNRWKLHLIDLVERIEKQGYEIRCGVGNRLFEAPYSNSNDKVFTRDLGDTLNEVTLIIDNHHKYGVPVLPYKATFGTAPQKSKKAVSEPPPALPLQALTLPQQIGWKWVWEHVPIPWFWYAGIGLIAVFAGGITVGKYADSVDKALHPERPAASPAPVPAPVPAAAPQAKAASK
jgi:hypothetical protein